MADPLILLEGGQSKSRADGSQPPSSTRRTETREARRRALRPVPCLGDRRQPGLGPAVGRPRGSRRRSDRVYSDLRPRRPARAGPRVRGQGVGDGAGPVRVLRNLFPVPGRRGLRAGPSPVTRAHTATPLAGPPCPAPSHAL